MKHLLAALAMLFAAPSFAQQPAPSSPTEQALGQKLLAEINSSIACSANLITVNQSLAAAQAKIKELEDKIAKPKAE